MFFRKKNMPSTNNFAQAQKKYLPSSIKVLFITEAPPTPNQNRYFFSEKVMRGDSLFLEMMKVLFTEEVAAFDTVKALRAEKIYFLQRFQASGFHLIHATDEPQPDTTTTTRRNTYRKNLPLLMQQIDNLAGKQTPLILISAVVFEACAEGLKKDGYQVLHQNMIEFPNSGQQVNFRRKFSQLLEQYQLRPQEI